MPLFSRDEYKNALAEFLYTKRVSSGQISKIEPPQNKRTWLFKDGSGTSELLKSGKVSFLKLRQMQLK